MRYNLGAAAHVLSQGNCSPLEVVIERGAFATACIISDSGICQRRHALYTKARIHQLTPRVFFSFDYDHDLDRAIVVRDRCLASGCEVTGFIEADEAKQLLSTGEESQQAWVASQLQWTSVTVVLVGAYTCDSGWVRLGVELSEERGNAMVGIDVSKIKDSLGMTTERCGRIPHGHPFFLWNRERGKENIRHWIDAAAKSIGW